MSVKNEKVSKPVSKATSKSTADVIDVNPGVVVEASGNNAVGNNALDTSSGNDGGTSNKALDENPTAPSKAVSKSKEDLSDVVAFKSLTANKLSVRSEGLLSYQLGFVSEIDQLFIRLQANETGGYFSKEWVPVEEIEACLLAYASDAPGSKVDAKSSALASSFSAVILKPCFKSKSQNNAGFLAAVLKAEGFISQVPEKSNLLSFDKALFDAWVISNKVLAKQEVK